MANITNLFKKNNMILLLRALYF